MADSTTQIISNVESIKPAETGVAEDGSGSVIAKEVVPDSIENAHITETSALDTQVEKNEEVTPPPESKGDANGHSKVKAKEGQENGNGHTEAVNGVEEESEKVEEEKVEKIVEVEEPAAKRAKKTPKAKEIKSGSRRSSSRLVSTK